MLAASSAAANGVTFPIAEGVSGPYEYQVGVGPFSPMRKSLFVAVTLTAAGNPVIDANVTVTVSVDGSPAVVGPLEAANSLTHLPTYELSLDLPELAREVVSLKIEVDSRRGPAAIEADMIVPRIAGTFDGDSVPATAAPRRDRGDTTTGRLVHPGLAVLAGLVGVGLGAWGLVRYRRRSACSNE